MIGHTIRTDPQVTSSNGETYLFRKREYIQITDTRDGSFPVQQRLRGLRNVLC